MSRPKMVPRAPVRRVRNVASVTVDHAVPDDWAHAWVARLLENAPAQRSGCLQQAPASNRGRVLMQGPRMLCSCLRTAELLCWPS